MPAGRAWLLCSHVSANSCAGQACCEDNTGGGRELYHVLAWLPSPCSATNVKTWIFTLLYDPKGITFQMLQEGPEIRLIPYCGTGLSFQVLARNSIEVVAKQWCSGHKWPQSYNYTVQDMSELYLMQNV